MSDSGTTTRTGRAPAGPTAPPAPRPRQAGVAALLAGVVLLTYAVTQQGPLPFPVEVEGTTRAVLPGTTLEEAADAFGVRPRAGDLLDVDGELLERDAVPGAVLLNGRRATPGTMLSPGDRITTADGDDRTEPIERVVTELEAGTPSNPQFLLISAPGQETVRRGAVSGKVVSVSFVPTGPAKVPNAVALTFDDGPTPTYTPQILDILERFDVQATFFVVGYLAERFPDIVRRQVEVGMQVASHSWGHPLSPPFRKQPPRRMREEIVRGTEALEALGARVTLFRPPQGSFSPDVVRVAERYGLRLVLWNVDPGDWRRGATANSIVKNVLAAVRPGSIILLHDGGGDREATLRALPRIIRGIREMGLELVTVDHPLA
ncbi:MAG: polysaccharide deacetylase family protein [Actinobacteria bacterium]|nr:polysaccharide deacetylase family protein [Actinomycetota bacterium]